MVEDLASNQSRQTIYDGKKRTVAGVVYKYTGFKKYILWALKLMEDMPHLFCDVVFLTPEQVSKGPKYDIYIVDDL